MKGWQEEYFIQSNLSIVPNGEKIEGSSLQGITLIEGLN